MIRAAPVEGDRTYSGSAVTLADSLVTQLDRNWIEKVNEPLTDGDLQAVRKSAQRGSPFGDSSWQESTVARLGLESTLRPRGRPQVRFPEEQNDKESRPLCYSPN